MTILTVYKNTAFGPSVYGVGDKLEDARNYYNESVQLWDYYLKQPPKEVTEPDYWDALEALMPLRMTKKGFQMREFKTGNYTSEYYKEKGKFYCHVVDASDPTTWKI